MTILSTVRSWIRRIGAAIAAARRSPQAPAFNPDRVSIYVRPEDGPVVETKHTIVPLSRVPVTSPKANAKRMALEYARHRTGDPGLTWKRARQLMNAWGRLERMTQ